MYGSKYDTSTQATIYNIPVASLCRSVHSHVVQFLLADRI
jgi:hypothetical protein